MLERAHGSAAARMALRLGEQGVTAMRTMSTHEAPRARALVLDISHHVLLVKSPRGDWELPSVELPAAGRPLPALTRALRELLGAVELEVAGAKPFPVARDFVFILERGEKGDHGRSRVREREGDQVGEEELEDGCEVRAGEWSELS